GLAGAGVHVPGQPDGFGGAADRGPQRLHARLGGPAAGGPAAGAAGAGGAGRPPEGPREGDRVPPLAHIPSPGRLPAGNVDVMGVAADERRALSALFEELGPDAPTLCEGWTTRD